MIVLDASAAVAVFLNLGLGASRIREWMAEEDDDLHVPHLFELEILNVLRRYFLHGVLSRERARLALGRLSTMSITRYPHTALLPRIWELRENVTAYDAAYIALAETLNAPLVTTDARLARVPGIRASVELFE